MPVSWYLLDKGSIEQLHMVSKVLPPKSRLMRTRISNRAIATIQVIGWMAIVAVMGMFLAVIGAGITECLASPR